MEYSGFNPVCFNWLPFAVSGVDRFIGCGQATLIEGISSITSIKLIEGILENPLRVI